MSDPKKRQSEPRKVQNPSLRCGSPMLVGAWAAAGAWATGPVVACAATVSLPLLEGLEEPAEKTEEQDEHPEAGDLEDRRAREHEARPENQDPERRHEGPDRGVRQHHMLRRSVATVLRVPERARAGHHRNLVEIVQGRRRGGGPLEGRSVPRIVARGRAGTDAAEKVEEEDQHGAPEQKRTERRH